MNIHLGCNKWTLTLALSHKITHPNYDFYPHNNEPNIRRHPYPLPISANMSFALSVTFSRLQIRNRERIPIMRAKHREVTDGGDIVAILRRCDTVRVCMNGNDAPYVTPMSFGFEAKDGMPAIYFHCARHAARADLMTADNHVCVEAGRFFGYEVVTRGTTSRHESAIGFGTCDIVTDDDEILHGPKLLCEHCGFANAPLSACLGLETVRIYRVTFDSLMGKSNLPDSSNDWHWD